MIDATDEVVSAPTQPSRRRGSGLTAKSSSRRVENQKRTSLTLDRVFSDPKINPFDQLEWERHGRNH